MSDQLFTLSDVEVARNPAERRLFRGAIAAAVVLHVCALSMLWWWPHRTPVRVSVARQGSISAYMNVLPAPAATSGSPRAVSKPRPFKIASAATAPKEEAVSNESPGAAQTTTGAAQGGGPVRMSTGQIQLLTKIDPIYPPLMISAKRTGTVVLDATINSDGSIGDVKVLQSLGPLFDRAAVQAVKQWRYSPPGFEAVLTVTVIFSLR